MVAPPVLVGTVVLVADGTQRLWALSAQTGGALWVRHFDDIVSASPTVAGSVAAVATDDGRITTVDLADGSTVWERELGLRPRSGPVLVGDTLVVADPGGAVEAFDVSDGTPRWSRALEAGLEQGPAARPATTARSWSATSPVCSTPTPSRTATSSGRSPCARRPGASRCPTTWSWSRSGSRVEARDTGDGTRLWHRDVPQTDAAPTLVGDQVVLPTRDGRVLVLDARTGRTDRSWRLPLPVDGAPVFADVSPGLVGRPAGLLRRRRGRRRHQALGLPGRRRTGLRGGAAPDLAPAGRQRQRAARGRRATPPSSRPAAPWSASIPTGPRPRWPPAGLQTGAVVRDGIAYARVDDELQAIDVADGEVLWSAPAGAAQLTAQPAVSDDTVVFGSQDEGLVSVDRETVGACGSTPLPDAVAGRHPAAPARWRRALRRRRARGVRRGDRARAVAQGRRLLLRPAGGVRRAWSPR